MVLTPSILQSLAKKASTVCASASLKSIQNFTQFLWWKVCLYTNGSDVAEILKIFLVCFWEKPFYYYSEYEQDREASKMKVPFKLVRDGDNLWVFYFYNAARRNPQYLWNTLDDTSFQHSVCKKLRPHSTLVNVWRLSEVGYQNIW